MTIETASSTNTGMIPFPYFVVLDVPVPVYCTGRIERRRRRGGRRRSSSPLSTVSYHPMISYRDEITKSTCTGIRYTVPTLNAVRKLVDTVPVVPYSNESFVVSEDSRARFTVRTVRSTFYVYIPVDPTVPVVSYRQHLDSIVVRCQTK